MVSDDPATMLLRQFVELDPFNDEYDQCNYCHELARGENPYSDPPVTAGMVHEPDCIWIAGCRLLGIPIHRDEVIVPFRGVVGWHNHFIENTTGL